MLVQRAICDAGHCGFNYDEQVGAFTDSGFMVEDNIRPDGDNVLDPEVVDDWGYGYNFIAFDRPCAVTCP